MKDRDVSKNHKRLNEGHGVQALDRQRVETLQVVNPGCSFYAWVAVQQSMFQTERS